MPDNLENALFFAGGRIVYPSTTGGQKGLKLVQNTDGSWILKFEAEIVAEEAKDIIRRFTDFPTLEPGEDFADKHQNQVYMEAFTSAGDTETKDILCKTVELSILHSHKTESNGQIILRLIPVINIAKTQNAAFKTQNVGTGTEEV